MGDRSLGGRRKGLVVAQAGAEATQSGTSHKPRTETGINSITARLYMPETSRAKEAASGVTTNAASVGWSGRHSALKVVSGLEEVIAETTTNLRAIIENIENL